MVHLCFPLADGSGGWNPKGCNVQNSTDNETVCGCNHLTSFAILLVRRGYFCFHCSSNPNFKHYSTLLLFVPLLFLTGPLQRASNQSSPGHHPYLHHLYWLWNLRHLPVYHPPHLLGLWVSINGPQDKVSPKFKHLASGHVTMKLQCFYKTPLWFKVPWILVSTIMAI